MSTVLSRFERHLCLSSLGLFEAFPLEFFVVPCKFDRHHFACDVFLFVIITVSHVVGACAGLEENLAAVPSRQLTTESSIHRLGVPLKFFRITTDQISSFANDPSPQ